MYNQLVIQAYEVIADSMKKYFTPENLPKILDMYVRFPQMPYYNLLLIAIQCPKASLICGRQAWEIYGGEIIGQKPIILLTPTFMLLDEIDEDNSTLIGKAGQLTLKASPCYDVSQVNIPEEKMLALVNKTETPNFIDALRKHNQRVLEDDINNPKIKHSLIQSVYEYDSNTLLLNPRISPEEKQKQALKAFVTRYINKTYCDVENQHNDIAKYWSELQDYATEILERYYGIAGTFETTPSELFDETSVVQGAFLRELRETVFTLIQSLDKQPSLSFNETMFCNIFLKSTDRVEILNEVNDIVDRTYSQQLLQDLLAFRQLFISKRVISDESIEELYRKKETQELFTFPSKTYSLLE